MFTACANPECHVPFTYGRGRLFRFHKNSEPGQAPPNTHSVQHFWLCGECCLRFTLELQDSAGVVMKTRPDVACEQELSQCISAA